MNGDDAELTAALEAYMLRLAEGFSPSDFYVTNMYGAQTRRPLVSVKLMDRAVQVTPTKAREMAQMLIQAAESADQDGFIATWASEHVGAEDEAALGILADFREWREGQRVRDLEEDQP
jgi:hypothetical protein